MNRHKLLNVMLLLAMLAVGLAGCKTKDLKVSVMQAAPMDIETKVVSSTDTLHQQGDKSFVTIEADFPIDGNFLVINSIQEWMSEMLGGTYSGKKSASQKMLDYYVKEGLSVIQEYAEDREGLPDMELYSIHRFTKVYETKQVVTYRYVQEDYLGGAHGSHLDKYMTFRKMDGRRLDWDIFLTDGQTELAERLEKMLLDQYFKGDADAIFKPEYAQTIPLPACGFAFVKDGVKFVYQEYEIACYAAGTPSCVLPYSVIEPYLTYTGKSLLRNDNIAEN